MGKIQKKSKKTKREPPPEPTFDCICCHLNYETLKTELDKSNKRGKNGERQDFTEPFELFSRPENLPCEDCEGLKTRFSNYMGSTLQFSKDCHGFIRIMCKPANAFYLLKGTAVLNHFLPPDLQGFIKFQ